MKTDAKNVREIEKLLRQYEEEVNKADYKDKRNVYTVRGNVRPLV